MKIETRTLDFNGKPVKLYTTAWKGKKVEFASIREAILYGMGFGTDQAAGLRYEMAKLNKKTTKRKRGLRQTTVADKTNVAQVKRLIPYK